MPSQQLTQNTLEMATPQHPHSHTLHCHPQLDVRRLFSSNSQRSHCVILLRLVGWNYAAGCVLDRSTYLPDKLAAAHTNRSCRALLQTRITESFEGGQIKSTGYHLPSSAAPDNISPQLLSCPLPPLPEARHRSCSGRAAGSLIGRAMQPACSWLACRLPRCSILPHCMVLHLKFEAASLPDVSSICDGLRVSRITLRPFVKRSWTLC
jgi:hypothetical protein